MSGAKSITIKTVAEEAGVSIATVSRYFKDPESINPISAVRVAHAIKKMNYVPSLFAQSLKRGHSNTIGVLVPDLTPYFSKACVALTNFFFQNKYLLIICDTGYDASKERSYLRSLMQQRVAGLIVVSSEKNENILSEYTHQFTKIILLDRDIPHEQYDSVCENNAESAYQLTRHLLTKEPGQLALLFSATAYQYTIRRYESAMKAIEEAGFSKERLFIATDLTNPDRIYNAIKEFTAREGPQKAIISFNPIITEGATMALNALDIRIGEDVRLAGFTLDDYQSKYRYSIPRIVQRPYDLGMKAGEVMLRHLRRTDNSVKSEPKGYILKNELIKQ
jgi:LacI family transcriptional regulator